MNPPRTTSQPEPLVTQEPTNESRTGELSHYKTQLAAIERVSQTLFQSINLDELVETTLRIALEEVDGEAGSILLADPETQQLVFQYSIGEKPVPRGTAINPLTGRNRTPTTYNLDLGAFYPIKFGESRQLRIQVDWFNVTNAQRAIRQDETLRINSGIPGAGAIQFPNPFYGQGTIFQYPSSLRLGIKFQF